MTYRNLLPSFIALGLLASCASRGVKLDVTNDNDFRCEREIVELSADSIAELLGADCFYIVDADGNEIPSQFTADGKFIFVASADPKATVGYRILRADSIHQYDTLVCGRLYPERADDVAWENEYVGFRAYGPATQAKGEKAYGYDIFFKYPGKGLVLEKLYGPETSPATWAKVDSLRKIDPQQAEDFINSFSYHIDHGLGMDCYAVGPTLGDGVAALLEDGNNAKNSDDSGNGGDSANNSNEANNGDLEIAFPWCYEKAEVVDSGPLRFTVRLDFAPVSKGRDENVTEHRLITLDAGKHLNRCRVWFDGLTYPRRIAAGIPLRDDSHVIADIPCHLIAYADPTQGPDNGKAQLGVIMPGARDTLLTQGHALILKDFAPTDTLDYYWGFSWNRADIATMEQWHDHLSRQSEAKPLRPRLRR